MVDRGGSVVQLMKAMGLSPETVERVSQLWGKSAARNGGRRHLLLGHLLDTAAVAELMWDQFLSPAFRQRLDEISGGRGRLWFMWVCGIHDCGKACPAFQAVDSVEAAPVLAAGLNWGRLPTDRRKMWRHDVAGAALLKPRLVAEWGSEESAAWVWPLVAGHHGVFPPVQGIEPRHREVQGRGPAWAEAQRAVVDVFTRAVGFADLADVRPVGALKKAEQLALSGLIVMADWIASGGRVGRGLADAGLVSLDEARRSMAEWWAGLRLRGGWRGLPLPRTRLAPLTDRLAVIPRPSQRELVERAWSIPVPGLLIAEAPMGEGKTKAALAAAEVLAARFGLDGVFVAMPTQATSDPMYEQVLRWVRSFDPQLESQVALLHGRRRFQASWRAIWEGKPLPDGDGEGSDGAEPNCARGDAELGTASGFDDFGAIEEDADFGMVPAERPAEGLSSFDADGPAHWFLDTKRGLLTAFAVGTVDHLLHAATRTRHVMLRFAGLAQKVVIVDEVHAADVYMRQFLVEALRWLGQARVPVVLLSATLPPAQRQLFVNAYLSGVLGRADVHEPVPQSAGYPCVTLAYGANGRAIAETSREAVHSWREPIPVELAWLPDTEVSGARVAEAVRDAVADGGVALVVVNQVARAQAVYEELRAAGFDGQLHLLHARLCAAHRADRTAECLRLMGPQAGAERPERMVVIATQLAEQSFDVDADVLITDLAPTDLLLQRIGRLHRHSGTRRPEAHRAPRVLITGVVAEQDGVPRFLGASESIYGRWSLLRAAALVAESAGPLTAAGASHGARSRPGKGWSIPADVPGLVSRAYSDDEICPSGWREAEALEEWRAKELEREKKAEEFLLCRQREWAAPTLEGLHYAGSRAATQEQLDAVVRDGDPTIEAVIVHRVPGGYRAYDGTWLGVHGEVDDDEATDRLMGGTVRLPARLTSPAVEALRPLPGWADRPWLKYRPALVLEDDGTTLLGAHRVSYDDVLGLVVAPA
ncbi:CRISPR-associated helicase Cas3' [Streptomyces sp. XM83C]|jgi:CRISPR-associated endonuclease/helicase Cas3|uniref:CRISPR-associated helicase Cas3 n=1 Tax=Streptomyces thermocoprophilus TaxID=78356 RepID=A0ABV5V7R9_9ACTN|nr:CRISPR-associated helicase Cas3' [Streptomyces sp. XM83C]MCK1819191.1 CRISPR-associated helicase Cas3' [Streptomyces sp. XM83C]